MRIVVFGATGGTGREIVQQALDAGHVVTVVVRYPEALGFAHERLRVIKGDVLVKDMLAPAVSEHDAVISAIGTTARQPTTLYSDGIRNILDVMHAAGVRRLMCVSASGFETGAGTPLIQRLVTKLIISRLFRHVYDDMKRMEVIVKETGGDWTIVRPPRLTNSAKKGRYRVAVNAFMSQVSISRADLADYIVRHIDDPFTFRATIAIAY